MPARFPFVLGADLAGVIEAVGEGAARFRPGEEVFGQLLIAPLGSTGTYAEHVAVTEEAPLARVPEGLEPTVAEALPTARATALQLVESLEPLRVGSFAKQFAANAGARVIAVGRSRQRPHRRVADHPRQARGRHRSRQQRPPDGKTVIAL